MLSFKNWLTSIVLVGVTLSSFAQDKVIYQGAYWIRYYNQTKLSEKFTLHLELDERRQVNPTRQLQFFIHLHLHYQVKPWLDVAFGGNYNLSNSAKYPSLAVPEFRPWQEATLTKPLGKWQFQFRYRLDERFIHNNKSGELTDGYNFNLRNRFRFQFQREIKKISDTKSIVFRISEEVMFNTGNVIHTFDQNRAYTSLEYRFNKKWSIETGYLNQFQSRSDDGFNDRHIIRVTVYHKLDLRRKEE